MTEKEIKQSILKELDEIIKFYRARAKENRFVDSTNRHIEALANLMKKLINIDNEKKTNFRCEHDYILQFRDEDDKFFIQDYKCKICGSLRKQYIKKLNNE